MDKNFALLGLREDATKKQVEEAYARRMAKYHSSDYADDQDYARQKMAELKRAYEAAYARAETGTGAEDEAPHSEKVGEEFFEKVQPERERTKAKAVRIIRNTGKTETERKKKKVDSIEHTENTEWPYRSKRKPDQNGKIASIVSIVIALIIGAVTLYDAGVSDDIYLEDDLAENGYTSYYSEYDWEIYDYGMEIQLEIFNELDYREPDPAVQVVDETVLQETADRFATRYTAFGSMEDLCDHLWENGGPFPADSSASTEFQIESVLAYYGFPALEDVRGYVSPYSEEPIETLNDYVRYLNQYYRKEIDT